MSDGDSVRCGWGLALLALLGCGESTPSRTELCPAPRIERVEDDIAACRRSGGVFVEFGDTCVDSCERLTYGVCGQAMSHGCDCGTGRCFNGWECVPDRCAHHYATDAYGQDAQDRARAIAVDAEAERIRRRINLLNNASIHQELDELRRFKGWLRLHYPDYEAEVRTAAGDVTDHTQWDQYPNGQLVIRLVVEIRGEGVVFEWKPEDNHNIVVLWE